MSTRTVGIIGTGRFGQVLAALLERDEQWSVVFASRSKPIDGKKIVSLRDIARCDIIIPAVPISSFRQTMSELREYIDDSPLIVSVCSVMEMPEEVLREVLPEQCDVLVTHPVFGPQSTENGRQFSGLPLVWNPVRIHNDERLQLLKRFLENQHIRVVPLSSQEHDQIMAKSQAISFLFGMIGIELELTEGEFDTAGFKHILENQRRVRSDSAELRKDLFRHNRHARKLVDDVITLLQSWQFETEKSISERTLPELRTYIDTLDRQLITLLHHRMETVKTVGAFKRQHQLSPLQPSRWKEVLEKLLKSAEQLQLNKEFVSHMWNEIHEEALRIENTYQS